jgi:excisionase family DNA binding protein
MTHSTPAPLQELRGRLFLTRKEAAQLLELDPRTLGHSIEAGECPHVRVSGVIRIPTAAFLRWAGIDLENSGAASATDTATRSDLRPLKAINRYGNSDSASA